MNLIIKEHIGFWKPILVLAKTEIKIMFKDSMLGILWAFMKPLFTLFIFWFVFEIGLRNNAGSTDISKFDFMLVGFIPWFFIRDSLTQGVKCLRKHSQYITKVSFPVSTIMTFTNISYIAIHLILLIIMYIVIGIRNFEYSIYNLQILWYLPLMLLFFIAISWTTSILNVFYKDIQNIIGTFINGLFWLSGIVWNVNNVSILWIKNLLIVNPINYFVSGYRDTFLYNRWFWEKTDETMIFICEFIFVLFIGSYIYKRNRKKIPDFI